jgi:hypothetical protein
MQDRMDEQMFYLRSCFCIYQKMLSKDEDIFLETFMVSALKKKKQRDRVRDNDDCIF